MKIGISVIICGYNCAVLLPKTLKHLVLQKIKPGIQSEIILVDNNSTDDTDKIAKDIWNSFESEIPLNIITESKQGISHARKAGVQKAQYEYILFCDDDNWLAPDYAQTAFDLISENPQIGAVGGRSEVVSDVEIPFWFSSFQHQYAVGVQNFQSGDVTQRRFLWGAGIAVRRSVMLKLFDLGTKPLLTGRKGKQISAGDDTEMCQWIIWAGYKLWYSEGLRFKHFMPRERLTRSYYSKMLDGHIEAGKIHQRYFKISRFWKYRKNVFTRTLLFFPLLIKWILFNNDNDKTVVEILNFFPFLCFDKPTSELIGVFKKINAEFSKKSFN